MGLLYEHRFAVLIRMTLLREGEGQIFSKLCDRSALLSVVSHSLSAYITTLESLPLQRLSTRIAAEVCAVHSSSETMFQVSMWMCDLFHFPEGLAHCHDDIREGLVRVVRLVLHTNYPDLTSQGFLALAASPPVRSLRSYLCRSY